MNTATKTLTAAEIAREMKRTLKAAFPGTKFSVTGSRGTGYGWLSVHWTDGPTDGAVRQTVDPFRAEIHCEGILPSRHYSDAAEAWADLEVQAHPGRWASLQDHPSNAHYFATRRALADTDLTETGA